MENHETQPLEPKKITTQLDESFTTPRELILNAVIDQYVAQRRVQGHEVKIPPSNEDINFVLAKYCDEHPDLSDNKKQDIRRTIQTIFGIRIARNQGI